MGPEGVKRRLSGMHGLVIVKSGDESTKSLLARKSSLGIEQATCFGPNGTCTATNIQLLKAN